MIQETHEEKVITYVLGMLEDARARGTIKGGRFRLDAAGLKRYRELREVEKFKPTPKETETAYVLLSNPPEEVLKAYQDVGKIEFKWKEIHWWIITQVKRTFKTLLKK